MRNAENSSENFNQSLQIQNRAHRSGITGKVSPVQQQQEVQTVDQRCDSTMAKINGTTTIRHGRLKTAMYTGHTVPHTKPLPTSGNIETRAEDEL